MCNICYHEHDRAASSATAENVQQECKDNRYEQYDYDKFHLEDAAFAAAYKCEALPASGSVGALSPTRRQLKLCSKKWGAEELDRLSPGEDRAGPSPGASPEGSIRNEYWQQELCSYRIPSSRFWMCTAALTIAAMLSRESCSFLDYTVDVNTFHGNGTYDAMFDKVRKFENQGQRCGVSPQLCGYGYKGISFFSPGKGSTDEATDT